MGVDCYCGCAVEERNRLLIHFTVIYNLIDKINVIKSNQHSTRPYPYYTNPRHAYRVGNTDFAGWRSWRTTSTRRQASHPVENSQLQGSFRISTWGCKNSRLVGIFILYTAFSVHTLGMYSYYRPPCAPSSELRTTSEPSGNKYVYICLVECTLQCNNWTLNSLDLIMGRR